LENWLRNIRDIHRLHKDELAAIPDLRGRQRRLVELNVMEQVLVISLSGFPHLHLLSHFLSA
jgi:carbonic anhydrase